MASMMGSMMGSAAETAAQTVEEGTVSSRDLVTNMVTSVADGANENDMPAIKEWLESNPGDIEDITTAIEYTYDVPINIYSSDTADGPVQVNPATVMDALGISMGQTQTEMLSSMGSSYDVFTELLPNRDTWERDYTVVAGRMPESWDEVVLYIDENGRISDYTLYALGASRPE